MLSRRIPARLLLPIRLRQAIWLNRPQQHLLLRIRRQQPQRHNSKEKGRGYRLLTAASTPLLYYRKLILRFFRTLPKTLFVQEATSLETAHPYRLFRLRA
jgi:hypothetical protein